MDKTLYQLILASQSPRRKELLSYLGVSFKTIPSDIEEVTEKKAPHQIVEDLAFKKAMNVFQKMQSDHSKFVIGSDTIVYMNNEVLGKPASDDEARETLIKLSGKEHSVLTGVCFYLNDNIYKFSEETKVLFKQLSDQDIAVYLGFNEHLDKAGAYGIQGAAQVFVQEISGNYSNVVGFPLEKMVKKLEDILGKDWRSYFV